MSLDSARKIPEWMWNTGLWAMTVLALGNLYFIKGLVDTLDKVNDGLHLVEQRVANVEGQLSRFHTDMPRSKEIESVSFSCCGEQEPSC